jgi:hypothetical protein
MAPMLKAAKATATVAATFASIDNFMANRSLMRTMVDFAVMYFQPSGGVLSIRRRN